MRWRQAIYLPLLPITQSPSGARAASSVLGTDQSGTDASSANRCLKPRKQQSPRRRLLGAADGHHEELFRVEVRIVDLEGDFFRRGF
jgi:hypothetical protein